MKIGTGHRTAKDITKRLGEVGVQVCGWAFEMMKHDIFVSSLCHEPREIRLVSFTTLDFGFLERVSLEEVVSEVTKAGFSLCSPEDAPQFCLAHHDTMSPGTDIFLMPPIPVLGYGSRAFASSFSDSIRMIRAVEADSDAPLSYGQRFFVRDRSL